MFLQTSDLDLCDVSDREIDSDEEEIEDSSSEENQSNEDEDRESEDVGEATNSNDPKKRFSCGKCDKNFSSKHGCADHQRSHLG